MASTFRFHSDPARPARPGFLAILLAAASLPAPAYSGDRWTQFNDQGLILHAADAGRHLWLGTSGGLVRLDKSTGEQAYFNVANSALTDARIQALQSDGQGRICAASRGGTLVEFDGRTWSSLSLAPPLDDQSVLDLDYDSRGILWIVAGDRATREVTVWRRKSDRWIRIYLPGSDPLAFLDQGGSYAYGAYSYGTPLSLQADEEGNAWVTARSIYRSKLYRVSPDGLADSAKVPSGSAPYQIIVPATGKPFWLGPKGITTLTATGTEVRPLPDGVHPRYGTLPRHILLRAADGTEYWSLSKPLEYRGGEWKDIPPPPDHLGLGSIPLFWIAEDAGDPGSGPTLWASRGERVGRFAQGTWSLATASRTPLLKMAPGIILPRRDGTAILATYSVLATFDPRTGLRSAPLELPDFPPLYQSLAEDSRGRLWIKGYAGLARLGADGMRLFHSGNSPWKEIQGHIGPGPGFMAEAADGTLWAADSSTLIVLPKGSEDTRTWKVHRPPFPASNAFRMTSLDLHPDGSTWFAGKVRDDSPAGYDRAVMGRFDGRTWTRFTQADHAWLGTSDIPDLRCDGAGRVWARFPKGLLRWDGNAWREMPFADIPALKSGVRAMTMDADRRLVLASNPPEAALWTWNGAVFEALSDSRTKMKTTSVLGLSTDARGRLWMSLGMDGILIHDPMGTPPTSMPHTRGGQPGGGPSLLRIDERTWRLAPGDFAGEPSMRLRLLDLRGTEVTRHAVTLRPGPAGEWIWRSDVHDLPPGKYLLAVEGRDRRPRYAPFLHLGK